MLVCPRCFEQEGLRRRIEDVRPEFPDERCAIHPTMKGVPIEAVAEIVDPVFRQRYVGGPYDNRYDEYAGTGLSEILYDLTGADDDRVVTALSDALQEADSYWPGDGEEPFYSDEYSYVEDSYRLHNHDLLWRSFCRSLVHGQRFFNSKARTRIEEIFANFHKQRDAQGKSAVYVIEPGQPGSTFYRARVADDSAVRTRIRANPARHLGPPPARSRRPGRLNPSGVAALYASFDLDTCLSELRPVVGSIVASVRFEILKPICVLDTTRFSAPAKAQDPFARNSLDRATQWLFMRSFMNEVAKPIRPDDEHLDYIPTQAVAEFLAHHHDFKLNGEGRRIEAIIYRSAQSGEGKNIALLGAAAAVERLPTDDDVDVDISALEEFDREGPLAWWPDSALPPPRVRIMPGSLAEQRITGAKFTPVEYFEFDEELGPIDEIDVDAPDF